MYPDSRPKVSRHSVGPWTMILRDNNMLIRLILAAIDALVPFIDDCKTEFKSVGGFDKGWTTVLLVAFVNKLVPFWICTLCCNTLRPSSPTDRNILLSDLEVSQSIDQ